MKRQSLKLFAMVFVLGLATIFGAAVNAAGQSKLSFETDFAFQIGSKKMSAGRYEMNKLGDGKFLIRNVETKEKYLVYSRITARTDESKVEKIVFNRYGQNYFLREIFASRNADGIDLGETRLEKETRRSDERLAKQNGQPERVSVNLK